MSEFQECVTEDVLIAVSGFVGGGIDELSGIGVEFAWGVPNGGVIFCGIVSFAFFCNDVEEFRARNATYVAEYSHESFDIVSVYRSEISEIKAFEEVALFEDGLFDDVAEVLHGSSQPRDTGGSVPDFVFEFVVSPRGGDTEQVFFEGADIGADRHIVVIEDDEHVGIGGPGIVEAFVSEATGESAISDYGNDITMQVEEFVSLSESESCRNRYGGVPGAESIIRAFVHTRETADTAQFAIGVELSAPTGNNFVCVGLVSDVPDYFVMRSVVDVVESDSKFDGAETGADMARIGA